MNMFEEAASIEGMIKMRGLKQEDMAKLLGVSQPYVANKLRLLKFPPEIRERIINCGLSERHARTLLRLSKEEWEGALDQLTRGRMNVATCEVMVESIMERRARDAVEREQGAAAKVALFERSLEKSLSNLRLCGIGTRLFTEKRGERLYINITITV